VTEPDAATAPPGPDLASPEVPAQPNAVEQAAAALREERKAPDAPPATTKRGRGRPKGAKTRRTAPGPVAAEPMALELAGPSEAEIAVMGRLCSAAWKLLGKRLHRRPLEDAEARELAAAAIPVMNKYGGDLAQKYGAELALCVTVWGLWDITALPELEQPPASDTETVSPTGAEISTTSRFAAPPPADGDLPLTGDRGQ
jgi:hypothetical protein